MPLADFDQLYQQADDLPQPVGVAVAGGADRTVLEALGEAADRGWVHPILVGPGGEIRRIAAQCNIELRQFRIVDSVDVAAAAVAQLHNGSARLLMKGQVSTQELMSAVLDSQRGLRTDPVVGTHWLRFGRVIGHHGPLLHFQIAATWKPPPSRSFSKIHFAKFVSARRIGKSRRANGKVD